LRHEILSIFIAIFGHINQPCPIFANILRQSGTWRKLAQWPNALGQLFGNQFDSGTAINFHVLHTAHDKVLGHIHSACRKSSSTHC